MLLHCYLRDDAERLCILRPGQPLVLGRETDFLGLKERLSPGQCRSVSRQHVELRFLRAEARVEVKALGTNAVVLRSTQTGEELTLGKGDPPASLISGDAISLVISDGAGAVRLFVDMDVPCFNFAPSSSSRKRKLEEETAVASSSSSSSSSASSSSASSSASGGDARPKPWVDDGVEDGEDTDEMDLAALQKEFAEDEDDEGGDVSPRVTQELDMSIDDEVTSLAERLEKEKKKKQKAKVPAAKEEKPVASSEDIPWDSPTPKSKKRKLDSDSACSKPACSFGANCYRKNADHRARFSHPDDEAAAAPKPKEMKPAPAKPTATLAPKPTKAKAKDTTEAKKKAAPASGLAAQVVGKVVVLTGALMMARKEATAKLKEMGALVGSGVTRNTDIVICGDKAGAKLEKAESCGCEVWTEEKFMQLMNEWENRGSSKDDDNEGEEEEEEVEVVKEKAVSKKKAKPAAPVNDNDDDGEGEAEEEGDGDDELGGGGNWGQEGKVKLPKPKNTMEDGETREVESMSGGSKWQIKKCAGDIYYCLCPAWKNQNQPVDRRTCKHLREFLGDEYETVRCGRPASAPIVKAASKKDAPKLLLAHKWEPSVDPTGWWLSEKLDGVRAYWNGKAFISRLGNAFYAPDWFCEALPTNMPLDGELFGGRGKFQITVSVAKSQGSDVRWKNLKFQIFDAPGLNKTFEERIQAINDWFSAHPTDYAKVLKMTRCKGQSHLEAELKRIEQKSGEGVMLRKPKSLYVAGRSTTLLKVKSFHDAEAVVLSYEPGKGKHKGRVGALNCKMANGTRFKVGTGLMVDDGDGARLSDAEREDPPAVGAIITYRFQELTPDGVPRFPSYIGVRHDMDEPRDPVLTSKGTIDC